MANPKKGQLMQVIFPMVDKTDFASIESGITASDFNSAATKKIFGVNHGVSDAFTSATISKAATLVRSGIFQQTLKTTEANYDELIVVFRHPSCADQILRYTLADYDDSDIMSRLSDVGSDLRSYLVGMSGAISDIESQVDLNASLASDAHSAAAQGNSRVLVVQSLVSDIDSQLLLTASDVSDILSALDSQFVYMSNAISDMNSRVLLIQSNVSDVESALDSQFVWSSNFLSDMNSDLASKIGGITATVSASDMSDIASRVWATAEGTRVDSRILVIQSLVSDVDSQLNLNASMISDVESALDSQFVWSSNFLSDMNSDLASKIGGITASVSASDISDIASAVKVILASDMSDILSAAQQGNSRILVVQSNVSDVQSALDSQFAYLSNAISDAHSDLGSQIGGITATVSASDMSDIASRVWATALAEKLVTLNTSDMSDIRSAINAGPAATVTASDISDIASAVWANTIGARVDSRILVIQSNVSDVESQLDLNASMISDVQSALDSQFVWSSNFLSDMNSDLASKIGGITASVSASDISDIASAVKATLASDMSDILSAAQQTNSRVLVVQSNVSDVQSALDSQFVWSSNFLSDMNSDLASKIGGITATLTASDISDIASAVKATLGSDMSDILSAAQQTNSRVLVVQSMVSDVDSQLNLNASNISDIESALDSQFAYDSNALSDINSRILLIQSNVSDVESQLDVTQSQVSDIYSLLSDVSSDLTVMSGVLSDAYSNLAAGVTLGASSLSDISSRVNVEVLDVLNTDTFGEPTGAPGATVTLAQKLGYLYMTLRNKLTVTSSTKTFFDDAGNAEWTKGLTDDGTTYTEDEGA